MIKSSNLEFYKALIKISYKKNKIPKIKAVKFLLNKIIITSNKNKEIIASYARSWYQKNKEFVAQKTREYRIKNKDKIAQKKKEYRQKNKIIKPNYQLNTNNNIQTADESS